MIDFEQYWDSYTEQEKRSILESYKYTEKGLNNVVAQKYSDLSVITRSYIDESIQNIEMSKLSGNSSA